MLLQLYRVKASSSSYESVWRINKAINENLSSRYVCQNENMADVYTCEIVIRKRSQGVFSRLRTSINRWYRASGSTRCCREYVCKRVPEKIYEKGIYDSRISLPDPLVAPTTSGEARNGACTNPSVFTSFSSTTRRVVRRTVRRCSPSIFGPRFRFQCRVLRLVRTFKAA